MLEAPFSIFFLTLGLAICGSLRSQQRTSDQQSQQTCQCSVNETFQYDFERIPDASHRRDMTHIAGRWRVMAEKKGLPIAWRPSARVSGKLNVRATPGMSVSLGAPHVHVNRDDRKAWCKERKLGATLRKVKSKKSLSLSGNRMHSRACRKELESEKYRHTQILQQ